ncbi:dienelactone hydrolase family protein [Lacibacterium aquatile]|uniref:Dienelactone hydrolase family protein n=1 Tax=Lacibacterium aquatile TaxID=1168082 RepID=A0ABW5DZE5_9PROT
MGERVEISADDGGHFGAYKAEPSSAPKGGILLIQEIFGVNQVMRDLADAYAGLGYRVLCPDLFWRQEPGVDITDRTEAEWQKAFALFGGFDIDLGVADLKATAGALRRSLAGKKVGSVGYCLGGKLAFLMATRSDLDCNVSYYGVGLHELLGETPKIRQPLLMHIAAEDKFSTPEARDTVTSGMAKVPTAEVHVYPGVNHAFARVGGEHFDAPAATLANDRTRAFFQKHIG